MTGSAAKRVQNVDCLDRDKDGGTGGSNSLFYKSQTCPTESPGPTFCISTSKQVIITQTVSLVEVQQ